MAAALGVAAFGCEKDKTTDRDEATAEKPTAQNPGAAVRQAPEAAERPTPPEVVTVDFNPSKFITCGESVRVCVEGRDPDGSELEASWEQVSGEELREEIEVLTNFPGPGTVRQCVKITPDKGTSKMKVTIKEVGNPKGNASDTLTFPLHVSPGNC